MKSLTLRMMAWLGLALAALPASAAFHFFTINELYSNADGSVQFIELTALAGGQQFTSGHPLISSSGGVQRVYNVTSDLPGDTGGRRFLFGTQGFAALGVVQPDYIIPNNFLFPGGGTINWAGADIWDHGALPTDGELSLNRNGVTGSNSPQNFAGNVGHVVANVTPTPVPNFQGLWWKNPPPPAAGNESGWGVNLTHQGNFLFITWFTYDLNGNGMWLAALLERVGATGAVFSGPLSSNRGAALTTEPWPSSSHVVSVVGNATMNFTDANTGTFTYTVNGVTQSKPITRQVFATPVPECLFSGARVGPFNYSDLWWRTPPGSEDGWGINLIHQGNLIFATWFTYGPDGNGLWLAVLLSPTAVANQFSGDPLSSTRGAPFNAVPWDPALFTTTRVGSATITFTDATHATFTYTFNGVTQTKTIERQIFASPASICR